MDVKLLVTFIYSFSKLDIRMSAGYRNIYSTERLGCIAIEVKSGCCIFLFIFLQYIKTFNLLQQKHVKPKRKRYIYGVKTFLTLKKSFLTTA